MEKVTISVTQEDIDGGVARNCSKCPIALAISKVFGEDVTVTGVSASINDELWELPKSCLLFARCFDRSDKVIPFDFEMEKYEGKGA